MLEILSADKTGLLKKASLLTISASTLAEQMRNGNFRSLYRGQGIEFDSVREYLNGDNVRAIDWNVTARMGKPFIKQYEEDRDLNVFFVLDRSASMFLGSDGKSRLECASEAAALLLLAASMNGSSVGAVFFDGKIRFSAPPKSGPEQQMLILSHLDELESSVENGSVLQGALAGATKLLRKRSLVFVISDFRSTGYQQNLARLAIKNDVVAIRITDPSDASLSEIGSLLFSDVESPLQMRLPTLSKKFKQAWLEENRRRLDKWSEHCIRHGIHPLQLSTTEDPALVLSRFFLRRAKR
jgi:uncharacterized protein (DUF58 family)